MTRPIEIVISGGDGGGKSTGIPILAEKLRGLKFRVFTTREVATDVILGGVHDIGEIIKTNPRRHIDVQRQILLYQRNIRERFQSLARAFADERVVILYDRAETDGMPYLPEGYFETLLQENHLNWHDVRDSYDAVFHLVTAADGAPEFYTVENNAARKGVSPDEAMRRDRLTLAAWTGHPHLRIIDNSTDFDRKIERLFQAACRVLALPAPLEIERKFILKGAPNLRRVGFRNSQRVHIEQMYLTPRGKKFKRIRKRSQGDSATYYITEKTCVSATTRYEMEDFISPIEYLHMRNLMDPATVPIRKYRYCFVYKNQYFELDRFLEPEWARGMYLLEIELDDEDAPIELPPFLDIDKEVTGDPRYENYRISKKEVL